MSDLYDDRPAWRRPVVYNDAPEPETADRPADVEDADPNPVEEFGIDDDDELDDEDPLSSGYDGTGHTVSAESGGEIGDDFLRVSNIEDSDEEQYRFAVESVVGPDLVIVEEFEDDDE